MLRQSQIDYLLIFLLILFSGNPLITGYFGKYSIIVLFLIVVVLLSKRLKIAKRFISIYKWIAISILLISVFQYIQLGSVSTLGVLNLLLKIFIGGYIINHLGSRLNYTMFKVVFHLSLISLVFYVVHSTFGDVFPGISLSNNKYSYVLYTPSYGTHLYKNAGMFWEPGAHAGLLTLCLAINFPYLKIMWQQHKMKLIVIIITLLTTQSTTGYLVGFAILLFYFLNTNSAIKTSFFLPIILFLGFSVYQATDFLKDKIEKQFENTTDQEVGSFSNTRFGSYVFDLHYIQKHPLIGNGLDTKTRYADHQYLFYGAEEDVIGSGNGLSNYLASMGVFFVVGYFYLVWKSARLCSFYFASVLCIVVFLNLQGEQWFNFPLYLGLPFILLVFPETKNNLIKNENRSTTYLPQ